jgi:hypothetical protein
MRTSAEKKKSNRRGAEGAEDQQEFKIVPAQTCAMAVGSFPAVFGESACSIASTSHPF